jgi:hypothetical protein
MANTHRGAWPPNERQIKLFWRKYDIRGEDECWPWKNDLAIDEKGYAHAMLARWHTTAHRISFALANGLSPSEVPPAVMHNCDYRRCGNPKHLVGGTQAQNLADMRAKGRAGDSRIFGEDHGRCKISDDQIPELIALYESGMSQTAVGKHFGIGQSQARRIIFGESRKHRAKADYPRRSSRAILNGET